MNDKDTVIAKVSLKNSNKSFIVVCAYLRPNEYHDLLVDSLVFKLLMIKERYKEPRIVCFGDFNETRRTVMKKIMSKLNKDFTCHFDQMTNGFTRHRTTADGKVEVSYLDYFITYGLNKTELLNHKPIGKSDHNTLQLNINNEEVG